VAWFVLAMTGSAVRLRLVARSVAPRPRGARRTGAGVAVLALMCAAGGVPVAQAAGPPALAPAAVMISPLPGTVDAPPRTQISFLGAPGPSLEAIVVRGSRSGTHGGRLQSYSTGTGASFVPTRPFVPGELVTVNAHVHTAAADAPVSTHFVVAVPYTLPGPPVAAQPAGTPGQVQSFHTRHDLHPPAVTVSTPAADPSLGDLFLTPTAGPGQDGPMIVDPSGRLVWFAPLPNGIEATDLRPQSYLGSSVLTWWQGQIIAGHGQGVGVIDSPQYETRTFVRAGNGLSADLHELSLTPQGTALITAYQPIHWDLSSIRGRRDGLLEDCVVQEIDVRTGLVMFEWHALGHVSVSNSYAPVPHLPGSAYDWFHINSIQQQANGDLLIDARNTWAAYLLSGANGSVEWTLGGKHSSFTLGPGVRFAWQHDAETVLPNVISIFDDEGAPPEASQSRAIDVAIDPQHHTATLARSFAHPGTRVLAPSQGNAQPLPDGGTLVGWGQSVFISEFSSAGQLTLDLRLPDVDDSYRAYRYPWTGSPATRPSIAAAPGLRGTTAVYASWNGTTQVAAWRVLTGSTPRSLTAGLLVARSGFETAMVVRGTHPYVAVQALAANGQLLGTSAVVRG
jgi:hypothetical protein